MVSDSILADTTRFAMPQPPRGAKQMEVGKKTFYSGMVSLETGSDTTVLRPIGFRNFEFESRSVNSIRYHALWPVTALHDSLPSFVTWLEYDIDTTSVQDTTPDLELPGQSEPPVEPEPEPPPNPNPGGNGNP